MAEVKGNLLERLISAVWDKVKSMLDNTSVEKLLAKTDVYSLAIAVKSIQDKARGLDKGIAKVEDGKMNTDTKLTVASFNTGKVTINWGKDYGITHNVEINNLVKTTKGFKLELTRWPSTYSVQNTYENVTDGAPMYQDYASGKHKQYSIEIDNYGYVTKVNGRYVDKTSRVFPEDVQVNADINENEEQDTTIGFDEDFSEYTKDLDNIC